MRAITDWAAAVNALLSSGLTAVEIADTVGVTRATVYFWAAGKVEPKGDSAMIVLSMCNKRNIKLQAKKNPAV